MSDSLKAAIWHEVEDVDLALDRLGLTRPLLMHAVQVGHLARISRTANDAPIAAGFYQWNETLRALRENLVHLGWQRSDDQGYATVVSPDGALSIAVSSGNEDTGRREATPKTRRNKGPRTAEAVTGNAVQLELFPDLILAPVPEASPSGRLTRILLFNAQDGMLHAELSLPVTMDERGHVELWRERIILPAQPLDPTLDIPEPDFGPDLDIDIQQRA